MTTRPPSSSHHHSTTPILYRSIRQLAAALNHTVTISPLLPPGGRVTRVLAHDPDHGRNARLTYRLLAQLSDKFNIAPQDGVVYVNFRFDVHRPHAEYQLTVVAEDDGIVPRSATALLRVLVNRSFPFPLPAGSRDPWKSGSRRPDVSVAVVAVGVLTLAALLGVVMLVLTVFARSCRTASPLQSTDYFQTPRQFSSDITPRSCLTVRSHSHTVVAVSHTVFDRVNAPTRAGLRCTPHFNPNPDL